MPQNTSNNSVRHKFAWFLLKSFISPPCPAKVLKSRGGKEPDTSRSSSSSPLTSGLTLTWVTPLCTAVPLSVEWGWKPGRTLDKTCEALSPCSARNPRSAKRQPLSSSPSRLKNSLPSLLSSFFPTLIEYLLPGRQLKNTKRNKKIWIKI